MNKQCSRCRQTSDSYGKAKEALWSCLRSPNIWFHFDRCQAMRWCFYLIIAAWRSHSWSFPQGKPLFFTQQKQWIHLASLQWLYHLWVLHFARIICWLYKLYGRLPVPDGLEGLFLFWIPLACVSLKWGNPYCFAMWHLKLMLKLSLDAFYNIEPATCSRVLIIKAFRPASC